MDWRKRATECHQGNCWFDLMRIAFVSQFSGVSAQGCYILFPDFTNQTDVAEKHASPFKLPAFLKHSYETARRDSRPGNEWEENCLCSVDMIRQKLMLLEETLRE